MNPSTPHDPALFINRELSWLAFNERVLEEAADATVPLLERIKFAAITASNLDEFFMVRVASLKRAVDDEDAPDLSGMTPVQQLAAVRQRSRAFTDETYRLVADELRPALARHGIRILPWNELDPPRQARLDALFRDEIHPVLTPLAIDTSRPFPLLSSLTLNLALLLEGGAADAPHRLAIVQVPPGLTRLVRVEPQEPTFTLLEDIIRAHLADLFPGQKILESACMRISRDAELELDDEGGRTHLDVVESELRKRRRSDVVRLEVEAAASPELLALLRQQLDIDEDEVQTIDGPLDLRVLMPLTELPGFEALREPPLQPVNRVDDEKLFDRLDREDILLHHPYDAYDPVLALLAEAAEDPDVLAIKMTLYRVSVGSPLIISLLRAAERNKQVTVLVEVTARFDEERNIHWARALEAAGAHVIYGVRGYKTHAKVCLIVRRTPDGLRRYVHLGTGNYNERTSRIYTDFGLMTSSRAICDDAAAVFNALTGYSDAPRLKKLTMAPTGLRQRFLKLIAREKRRAESNQDAEIVAKMNSLSDAEIIEALYAAARAGVKIRLNIRGICALRPGVKGTSTNIEVVSIVDRFLEHSRIFYFLNGGEDELYLASADWMTRNLDKRVELMFPVDNPEHRRVVLHALRSMFKDNVKARWLGADGVYKRHKRPKGEEPCRVQQTLQDEARKTAALARDRAGVVFTPEERKS
ncbi:MAG TPA: polyphosphate kinase 1 [Vicinamibacterales bacterium]|nr:polyphosphate kinase 1 [Vicinamibacterales bacterium]